MMTIDKLRSSGAVDRFNGILECLDKKSITKGEEAALRNLRTDSVIIAGRMISAYASAVLHLLGLELYDGEDIDTRRLIAELVN